VNTSISVSVDAAPARAQRIREILDQLVRQRQTLRNAAGEEGALEANRRSIVYWQGQLASALIEEHGPLD
jgi:hypothetical protein